MHSAPREYCWCEPAMCRPAFCMQGLTMRPLFLEGHSEDSCWSPSIKQRMVCTSVWCVPRWWLSDSNSVGI